MSRATVATLCLISLLIPQKLSAGQPPSGASKPRARLTWTLIGAAAGFGVGLFAGLRVFDDAINSDRKIWTLSLASAAGGGIAAWYLTQPHGKGTGSGRGPGFALRTGSRPGPGSLKGTGVLCGRYVLKSTALVDCEEARLRTGLFAATAETPTPVPAAYPGPTLDPVPLANPGPLSDPVPFSYFSGE